MESNNSTTSEAIQWYNKNRDLYVKLCRSVESILIEAINKKQIPIHVIHSRAKEIDSFEKKIQNLKYTNPQKQITDLAGIRIITYVESDLEKINEVITQNFDIDEHNSINKTIALGTDKVGYRSIHYIVKMPQSRIVLTEYSDFKDVNFEIQIRTILQHAWAEIEHDKNYKFSGQLPSHLQRRFKVLAGVLELADREFNNIANEVDSYKEIVISQASNGNLDININSTSLQSYLDIIFTSIISDGLHNDFYNSIYESDVLKEIKQYGINTLKQIDDIIPFNFIKVIKEKKYHIGNNYAGIIRSILMINDANKYFNNSWHEHFKSMHKRTFDLVSFYVPSFAEIIKKRGIKIIS